MSTNQKIGFPSFTSVRTSNGRGLQSKNVFTTMHTVRRARNLNVVDQQARDQGPNRPEASGPPAKREKRTPLEGQHGRQ